MRRAGVSDLVVELDNWDGELGGEAGEREEVVVDRPGD